MDASQFRPVIGSVTWTNALKVPPVEWTRAYCGGHLHIWICAERDVPTQAAAP